MAIFNNSIIPPTHTLGGDVVTKSLRFNDGDTPYLQRTTGTSSDQTKCTHSFWMKRGALGANQRIFEGGSNAGFIMNGYGSSNEFRINNDGPLAENTTTRLLRDTAAFYHICVAIDSGADEADKLKLYINGVRVTSFSRTDSIVTDQPLNPSETYATIGKAYLGVGSEHFDGYLADYYMLDGVAAAPTSFAVRGATGQWKPIAYSGSYGNNGFHLEFKDSSQIGLDSRSSGGAIVSWDTSKWRASKPEPSWSENNTQFDGVSGDVQHSISSFSGSGKYYAEFDISSDSALGGVGVCPATWWTGSTLESYLHTQSAGCLMQGDDDVVMPNSAISTNFDYTKRLGIEVDAQANTATFYQVEDDNSLTQLHDVDSTDGLDFADDVAWGATVYDGNHHVRGYFASSEWNGTPSAGFVEMPSGNHFTATNLAASDVVEDTPTDNYCTLNPLDTGGAAVLSEGNLAFSKTDSNFGTCRGTIGMTSGKWYFEGTRNSDTDISQIGILGDYDITYNSGDVAPQKGVTWDSRGYYYTDASSTSASTYSTGDTICVAFDADTKKVWFRKGSGSWESGGDPAAGTTPSYTITTSSSAWFAGVIGERDGGWSALDFGQSGFAQTPPTGFLALSTGNLATPTIAKPKAHFSTTLYTGAGNTTNDITGVGFQPDLVWIKNRTSALNHYLVDSARGLKYLFPNEVNVEGDSTGRFNSFDSDGFQVEHDHPTSGGYTSGGNQTYVAWCWKESAIAGFGISTWTGTGEMDGDEIDVAHGCGGTPELVIAKDRDGNYGSGANWIVWHHKLSPHHFMTLNTGFGETSWDSIYPLIQAGATNNTFGMDAMTSAYSLNEGEYSFSGETTYVAYSMRSIEGYSKIGGWEGTGVSGKFIYTGFRPIFLLYMHSSGSGHSWGMMDDKREPYNPINTELYANQSLADYTSSDVDFLSNGFRIHDTGGHINQSGEDYIFYAIGGSNKYSSAR